jgi:O-antigen ligase
VPAASAPARAPRGSTWSIFPTDKPTTTVAFVYLMWFVMLCDPQWWVAGVAFPPATKIPTPLYGVILLLVLFHPPKSWYPAFMAFILYTVALIPFAYNRGFSLNVAKMLVAFYVLALGSLALLRSIKLAVPIIAGFFMYSYLWWIAWGLKSGMVWWHPSLGNYDGYGPLVVMGIGSCYYFGVATNVPKERKLAYLAAILCIAAMVSSFARGAVLAGGLVMFWMWVRSQHKLRATVAGVVGVIGLVVAGSLVQGGGRRGESKNFFAEMLSSADENDATRGDREVLWGLAWQVFKDHPVLGVGANNFGPYAAERFRPGETGGGYDDNPARLYDRQLHSTFMQILCEYGVVGSAIFLWMIGDFWMRNRRLRRKNFRATWAERSGGRLDLHALSLGLECAMLGFLATGFFYNQIFSVHWFYSIIAINTLLYYHARPAAKAPVLRQAGARA